MAHNDTRYRLAAILLIVLFPTLLLGQFEDAELDSLENKVQIYPNPVSEVLYIKSSVHPTFAGIADSRGVIVGYIDVVREVQAIDVTGFDPGNYFLILRDISYKFRIE